MQDRAGFEWYTGEASFSVALEAQSAGAQSAGAQSAGAQSAGAQSAGAASYPDPLGLTHSQQTTKPETPSVQSSERRLLMSVMRGVLFFGIGLILYQGRSASPRLIEQMAIATEIRAALGQEMVAWRSNDRVLYASLHDPAVEQGWLDYWDRHWSLAANQRWAKNPTIVELTTFQVSPSQTSPSQAPSSQALPAQAAEGETIVAVTVLDERVAQTRFALESSLETRFYRRAEHGETTPRATTPRATALDTAAADGWVRTLPSTRNASLQEIEPLELKTPHLRLQFTQPDAVDMRALAFELEEIYLRIHELVDVPLNYGTAQELTLAVLPEPPTATFVPGTTQVVAAPRLLARPPETSNQELLRTELSKRIVDVAFSKTRFGLEFTYWTRWDSVHWSARGWIVETILGRPSAWDRETRQAFVGLPEGERQMAVGKLGYFRADRNHLMWQYVAGKSLFEYVAADYGSERAIWLIRGFNAYRSWADLLEDRLGVTVSEFEAGWNRYLQQSGRYGEFDGTK